jgi:hypothetical protein
MVTANESWLSKSTKYQVLTDSNNCPTPKTCGTDCGRVILEMELAVLVIGDSCKPQSTEDVLEHSCSAKEKGEAVSNICHV